MTVLSKNLKLLKSKYFDLYIKVKNVSVDRDKCQVIDTKNGLKTLKVTQNYYGESRSFFIHSKYDPVKEGERFAKEQYDPSYSKHILYGFGLGYHVAEILKLINEYDRLYIVENNIEVFRTALEIIDLEQFIHHSNVSLIVSDDVRYICEKIKQTLSEETNLILYPPSLKAIPNENEYFKFIMENWNLKKSITDEYNNYLQQNLESNLEINSPNIGIFFNKFINIPIVIVSSGPSLDKNIDLLYKVKGKALILSVGSALRPLLIKGITPDFFIIIDPKKETYKQIEGYEDLKIPFIYLATASAYTVSKYKGVKLIACQEKEYLRGTDKEEYLVDSGGSVATTALDIAIKMGGNPIVLVGQDLAYVNGKNHAEHGTHLNIHSPKLKNMRRVIGHNGETLYTSLGLLSFKYWIENRIKKEQRTFINATEGGAYIKGMKHIKLQKVIADYLSRDINISEQIRNILKEGGKGRYV